ncbi:MAG: putative toxin-antitoxin system toxin component, PIN family [Hyphomonadaceae bacterium]|nr:putative toxin-antitoxin system toxin component, PIN family [Hyphomonadaceae bacterium]
MVDTNVLVSAFRSRRGASNRVLVAAADGRFTMIASVPVFLEYEEVLKRAEHRLQHGLSLDQIDEVRRHLSAIIEPVEVRFLWRPQLRDPSDEMVLEAAINGGAEAIVTYNVADFSAAARFNVATMTPQNFLNGLA